RRNGRSLEWGRPFRQSGRCHPNSHQARLRHDRKGRMYVVGGFSGRRFSMTAQDVAATPRRSKNVPRLEGIRGIFALGVVTYHVAYTAGINVSGGGKGLLAHVLE